MARSGGPDTGGRGSRRAARSLPRNAEPAPYTNRTRLTAMPTVTTNPMRRVNTSPRSIVVQAGPARATACATVAARNPMPIETPAVISTSGPRLRPQARSMASPPADPHMNASQNAPSNPMGRRTSNRAATAPTAIPIRADGASLAGVTWQIRAERNDAHARQRTPTGPTIEQSGHTGLPHRPQDRRVSTRWRSHTGT